MDSGEYGEAGQSTNNQGNQSMETDVSGFPSSDNVGNNDRSLESNINKNLKLFLNNTQNEAVNGSLSQNNSVKNYTRKINTDKRYTARDTGPYHIYVEHTDLNIGSLHPMKVGRILDGISAELQADINEVKTVGRNRIKIDIKSGAKANLLVGDEIFKNNKLIAYIPQHLTEKKAIIRNVDTALSEEYILGQIISNVPVIEVKRLTRVATDRETGKIIMGNDGKAKRVPRQMVLITFQGLTLPEFIFINRVRCPVEKYIPPVVQCFNCFLYGHTATQCKGKTKCRRCGKPHVGDCTEITTCVHCHSTDHSSISKKCPVYEKQRKIKVAMSDYNISFKEAEKCVSFPSFATITKKNPYLVLNNIPSEFPSLPSGSHTNTHNRTTRNQSNNAKTVRNPVKRRKASSPEPSSFSATQPNFHFCGPPIQNNPHRVSDLGFTNQLTACLTKLIQNLLTSRSEMNSEKESEINEDRLAREIVDNTINNKTIQQLNDNDHTTMER